MNKQNAIRHYLSKAKKALKKQDGNWQLISNVQGIVDDHYCKYCHQEDFGYCGLRNSDITDEDRHVKYCLHCIIKYLENDAVNDNYV
jgi:hypothetical protein